MDYRIFNVRTWSLLCVRIYTWGLGTPSQHNIFDVEKLFFFYCAPDVVRTLGLLTEVWLSTNWATLSPRYICALIKPTLQKVSPSQSTYLLWFDQFHYLQPWSFDMHFLGYDPLLLFTSLEPWAGLHDNVPADLLPRWQKLPSVSGNSAQVHRRPRLSDNFCHESHLLG